MKTQLKKFSILFILIILSAVLILAIPLIDFTPDNPANATVTSNRSVEFWVNITEANLANVTWNWNETNYTIFDENLVLAYNFNNLSALGENDTHVFDISGNGNNGTVIGTENITWSSAYREGNYDGAFNFSGNVSYVDTNYDSNLNETSWAISLWVKNTDDTCLQESIFGKNYVYWISTTTSCSINFLSKNASSTNKIILTSSPHLDNSNWNHLFYTYDFSLNISTAYVNGINVGSVTQEGMDSNSLKLSVGGNVNGWYWNGSIDEIRLWNRTFNQNEISHLYYSNLKKFDSDSWQLYVNQTNITSITQSLDYTYYSCAGDSTTENCTETRILTWIPSPQNITSNFSLGIGDIRGDFYGTNVQRFAYWLNSRVDADDDGTRESDSNITWHETEWSNSNLGYLREYVQPRNHYSNTSDSSGVNFTGNLSKVSREVEWAYNNNGRVLLTYYRMPEWLANSTSNCNQDNGTCAPNNYTIWFNLINDSLYRVTNNGEYISIIDIEIWNEPNGNEWMENLNSDNITKATEYVIFYNQTRNLIKESYPNIAVGGLASTMTASNMLSTYLSNLTIYMDFVAVHTYQTNLVYDTLYDNIETLNDNLIANCSFYGANCTRIIWSEYNVGNGASSDGILMKNQSSRENEYGMQIGTGYMGALNNYPENISMMLFHWSEAYKYSNTANYPEYPDRWSMVSEPQLDNAYYPPYNTTKSFATYCPAGSTVYNSTSTTGDLVSVVCKDEEIYNVIVINKGDEAINLTLNLSGVYPYNNITNVETDEIFNLTEGVSNIGVLDQYEIIYFSGQIIRINSGLEPTDQQLFCTNFNSGIVSFFTLMPTIFALLAISIVVAMVFIVIVLIKQNIFKISDINVIEIFVGIMVIGIIGIVAIIIFSAMCLV